MALPGPNALNALQAGQLIRSRAPVRFDFAGGWTDVAAFCQDSPGKVVNACLRTYSYATLIPNARSADGGPPDPRIELEANDFDLYLEGSAVRKMEYDGNADLVKAAINRHIGELPSGFRLITRSDAPPGSGLGTSAGMGVALLGALSAFSGKHLEGYRVAEMASILEREELGILGGKQDHYASVLGGFNSMEFHGEDVLTSPMRLSPGVVAELEKSCILCYTGKSRLSGEIHERVHESYRNKGDARDSIEELKEIAEGVRIALLKDDLASFARLLNRNWACQKRLHPTVTNPQLEQIFETAFDAGAAAGKAGGAGGGGCVLFLCREGKEHAVRRALTQQGVKIVDCAFDFSGLTVWQADPLELKP